jgi:HK97 gp10 family phage protein
MKTPRVLASSRGFVGRSFLVFVFSIKTEFMPIEIEGLEKLSDMLSNIAPTAARRYMRKAVGTGATIVQGELKESAPAHIGVLEESIVQKASWDTSDDSSEILTVDIGPTKQAFWGMFQEFGTQDVVGVDKNGKKFHHTAQPAQRWMTNAWLGCRDRVLDVVATELTGLLMDLENKS